MMLLALDPAARYYTIDPEIQKYFKQVMVIYSFFAIPDFIAQNISGMFKGLGKSKDALKAFVFSFYFVGLPVSASLGLGTSL